MAFDYRTYFAQEQRERRALRHLARAIEAHDTAAIDRLIPSIHPLRPKTAARLLAAAVQNVRNRKESRDT
jgi:hypothetical protein